MIPLPPRPVTLRPLTEEKLPPRGVPKLVNGLGGGGGSQIVLTSKYPLKPTPLRVKRITLQQLKEPQKW